MCSCAAWAGEFFVQSMRAAYIMCVCLSVRHIFLNISDTYEDFLEQRMKWLGIRWLGISD